MSKDNSWIIGVILSFFIGVGVGIITGNSLSEQMHYIDCLLDIQNKKQPKYVLVKQWNGEVKWQYNKEYGK